MSILGNRVIRTEDPRFLSGESTPVADRGYPGMVHAVFVRSQMASATLAPIASTEAAVSHGGSRHIDMPCTAQRAWRATGVASTGAASTGAACEGAS